MGGGVPEIGDFQKKSLIRKKPFWGVNPPPTLLTAPLKMGSMIFKVPPHPSVAAMVLSNLEPEGENPKTLLPSVQRPERAQKGTPKTHGDKKRTVDKPQEQEGRAATRAGPKEKPRRREQKTGKLQDQKHAGRWCACDLFLPELSLLNREDKRETVRKTMKKMKKLTKNANKDDDGT